MAGLFTNACLLPTVTGARDTVGVVPADIFSSMEDPVLLIATIVTFLIAGAVKGVIGLGLPTVCLALMTVIAGLPAAMVLLLIPSFVTNLWQAIAGGHGRQLILRLWPFFILASVTVWIGASAFNHIDIHLLSVLLGALLVVYALISLLGLRINISRGNEKWQAPIFGIVNGVLTGMTGSFVVPGVLFLQAIGLSRDELIQAMGILFTVSTVALAVALRGNNLLTAELGWLSLAGLIPALIGMAIGQRIRKRLSEAKFKRVFLISVLLLGLYIMLRAWTASA